MKIADLMTREVESVAPEQTLGDVVALMRRRKIRHIPVVDGSKLVGIITDRDVKRALPSVFSDDQAEFERVLTTTLVEQVMTRDPYTVRPTASVKDVLKEMIDRKFGAVPVVSDGALVGIVTDIDFLRAFYERLK